MKGSLACGFLMVCTLAGFCDAPPQIDEQGLNALRWQHRVLLLAPDFYIEQDWTSWRREALGKEMTERRLVIGICKTEEQFQKFLRPVDTKFPEKAPRVVLIGLDGTTKWTGAQPPEPRLIFSLIDAMPMRAAEVRGDD